MESSQKFERCKFGSGQQVMAECKMIYIHWPGYYPDDESYQFALRYLCPNLKDNDERVAD
jgi:hypothetical protein